MAGLMQGCCKITFLILLSFDFPARIPSLHGTVESRRPLLQRLNGASLPSMRGNMSLRGGEGPGGGGEGGGGGGGEYYAGGGAGGHSEWRGSMTAGELEHSPRGGGRMTDDPREDVGAAFQESGRNLDENESKGQQEQMVHHDGGDKQEDDDEEEQEQEQEGKAVASDAEAGMLHKATSSLSQASLLEPSSPRRVLEYASMMIESGSGTEAEAAVDRVLEIHGNSSVTFVEAAQVIRASNREMSLRLYDRALDLDPSNSVALFGLSSLVLDNEPPAPHHVDRLRAFCQAACERRPTCTATLALLGRVELCSGNEGGARAAFAMAISISPTDDVAHCGLSQCEERWGTAESTERAYARAMASCPTSAEILSNCARWNEQEYLDAKDAKDGGGGARYADRERGRDHDQGRARGMRRRVDEAVSIYNKILEVDPNNLNALIRLGTISEYRDKDLKAASKFFKQAVEADPLQAVALSRLGKLSMSRAVGNESEVWQMLSLMTADEKRVWHAKCEIAASMLERALSIDPSDHSSLSTLGWYQVAVRKDGQAAAHLLSKALREAPDDPRLLQLYSKAMKMCGDCVMAKDAMDRSRVMKMVSMGMTEAEARERLRREDTEKQGKNLRLRNSNLAQARLTDEMMFGKIDKRLLTDEDWQTSIGMQGGTVFNVTSLRAKGLIQIETEEQERWFANYISMHEGPVENYKPVYPKKMLLASSAQEASNLFLTQRPEQEGDELGRARKRIGEIPSRRGSSSLSSSSSRAGGSVTLIDSRVRDNVAAAVRSKLMELQSIRGRDCPTSNEGKNQDASDRDPASSKSHEVCVSSHQGHGQMTVSQPSALAAHVVKTGAEEKGWAGLSHVPFGPQRRKAGRDLAEAVSKALIGSEQAASGGEGTGTGSGAGVLAAPSSREVYKEIMMRSFGGGGAFKQDTIFITGLDPDVDDAALRHAMSDFGQVVKAAVTFDHRTGVSRCRGRVAFSTAESAQASIAATDGSDYKGLAAKGKLLASKLALDDARGRRDDDGGQVGISKRVREEEDGFARGEARKRGRGVMPEVDASASAAAAADNDDDDDDHGDHENYNDDDGNDASASRHSSVSSDGSSQAREMVGDARMTLLEQSFLRG